MMNREDLYKYFAKSRVSESTIKTHISRIMSLNNNKYKNIKDMLNDSENLIKIINNMNKTSTKKAYLISLVSIGKKVEGVNDKDMERLYNRMLNLRDKNNNEINNNEKSKKQEKNWVEWEEIKKVPELILKDLNKNNLTKYQKYDTYTRYVIISMYTKIPPVRLDYHKILVFEKKEQIKKYKDYDRYLILEDDNITIQLNKFKNVKKIGKQTIKLPKDLSKIIKDYYKFLKDNKYPHEYLFYSPRYRKEFTSNSFGKYIQSTFKRYINKDITINMLRHSYETNLITTPGYQKLSLNEREKLHRNLLHSMNTALQYMKLDKSGKKKIITLKEGLKILESMGYEVVN